MRETFHLVPAEIWTASDTGSPYESWSLATEGFTHCTDGVEALGATFDRFYVSDPRPFVALSLDLDALDVNEVYVVWAGGGISKFSTSTMSDDFEMFSSLR